jgi:hypothetical protein
MLKKNNRFNLESRILILSCMSHSKGIKKVLQKRYLMKKYYKNKLTCSPFISMHP